MKQTKQRRGWRVLVALASLMLFIWAAYMLLGWWAERALANKLHQEAEVRGARWVQADSADIRLDLWSGDLFLTGIHWESSGVRPASGVGVYGSIDTLHVQGLSYSALLFKRELSVRGLVLRARGLAVEQVTSGVDENEASSKGLKGFAVDNLDVQCRSLMARTADSTVITMDELAISAGRTVFDPKDTVFAAERCMASIVGMMMNPFADSSLVVERIDLHEGSRRMEVVGLRFGPNDVISRSKSVREERDVIAGTIERIELADLDLTAIMRGMPHTRSIRIGPTQLRVARDKSRPDQAFSHKPLPQRLLRGMPLGAGCDSLIIERMAVHYNERVDIERGFAFIPFDSIQAVLTGFHHRPADSLRVQATGMVFGRTPIALDLHGLVGDSTDLVVVEARVGRLPFPALNKVLQPLTGVATPEGRLDTLIMRMRGGDRTANASCWMRYDGLKLDLRASARKKDKRLFDPVFDALLNAMVKSDRTGHGKNEGWKNYSWERRRDRALFNYLWAGVREGAKANMLHGVVLEATSIKARAGGK